jgi:4-hydroxybutyrate CoA-transferase
VPRELDRADLSVLARPGDTVFVAGGTAEPTAILAEWREARCLNGVTLTGLQLPGLNDLSPSDFGDTCRYRANFLSPGLRRSLANDAVDLMPMHHAAYYAWLAKTAPVNLAVFQVAPPDRDGLCNLGPCTDLLPAILSRSDVQLVAQLNQRLPACRDGVTVPLDRLDAVYRADTALPEFRIDGGDPAPGISENAARLVDDGTTVQIGIGKLPDQVLSRLTERRRLTLHGGTVTASALALLEQGAATRIVAGVALGDEAFYARVAAVLGMEFRPVMVTHGVTVLSRIEQFVAINTALEVDLFGQANCEVAGGKLRAGFGGINDFLRAAQNSSGGRSVLMLPASRIVARIGNPGLVSIQRGDVDTVVTEHGMADLRGRSMQERAAALIAIAAPDRRTDLETGWKQLRDRLA